MERHVAFVVVGQGSHLRGVPGSCWRCGDPAQQHRDPHGRRGTATGRTRHHRGGFQLESGEKILAWTTTPWTLPSNLALAVGPGRSSTR
ncbi:MAG: class I tRNA ligase family protein [Ilumatobacteraceae bacterium]